MNNVTPNTPEKDNSPEFASPQRFIDLSEELINIAAHTGSVSLENEAEVHPIGVFTQDSSCEIEQLSVETLNRLRPNESWSTGSLDVVTSSFNGREPSFASVTLTLQDNEIEKTVMYSTLGDEVVVEEINHARDYQATVDEVNDAVAAMGDMGDIQEVASVDQIELLSEILKEELKFIRLSRLILEEETESDEDQDEQGENR